MKLPYIDLFIGDWLKDPISGCSLAAQGLWLRLMFIMQESPNRGYLCQPDNFATPLLDVCLARRCGCDVQEYVSLMAELFEAGVPSKTESGVIYSRRMVRDEALRLVRADAGSKGGKARLLKQNSSKPSSKPQANTEDEGGDGDVAGNPPKGIVKGEASELAKRIGIWFKRRESTKWTDDELKRLAKIEALNTHPEDLDLLEKYYKSNSQILRRDPVTLLNNWNTEIDRARGWKDGRHANPIGTDKPNPRNVGTCASVTDYAAAGRRKLERQEAERRQSEMGNQVAQDENASPAITSDGQ